MNSYKQKLVDLCGRGVGGILLALGIIALCVALFIGLVTGMLVLGWAIGGAIIYYGADLVGYPIAYKVAYGASMLLTVISGVFGGIKITNTK